MRLLFQIIGLAFAGLIVAAGLGANTAQAAPTGVGYAGHSHATQDRSLQNCGLPRAGHAP